MRNALKNMQQFCADSSQWALAQEEQKKKMSDFTASAVVAFSETQQAVQGQANQIEFLAHSVGAQRSQMEEMRQKMEQDMRQAMEASIAQRVQDEAGAKSKQDKTYKTTNRTDYIISF